LCSYRDIEDGDLEDGDLEDGDKEDGDINSSGADRYTE